VLALPPVAGEVIGVATWWRSRAVARAVRGWLAEEDTRVFHAHSRAGLVTALRLARAGERRIVASVHCYGRQRWFYRVAARQLGGRMFWLSPAMKRYYGVPGDDWAQCIPGCIPEPAEDVERGPGRPALPIRLGGVGALVRWKGWHLVLEALARLPAEVRSTVRFAHIGAAGSDADSQAYARELAARTDTLGLRDVAAWQGEQASAQAFLGTVDVLVVASEHEPFSIAVLEALAAGRPVLAADSGGARDLLVGGQSGWFFRSGDAADLARAMRDLATDAAWAGVRTGASTVRPFVAPTIAAQWHRVYEALIQGGR
jgi:glycosyltransferase involved in cell wall biosynthesis